MKVHKFQRSVFKSEEHRLSVFKPFLLVMLAMGIFSAASLSFSADKGSAASKEAKTNHRQVNLFNAMEQGLVDVKFVAKSTMDSTLTVKNKSGEPLVIDMPSAFAGVPIVAQFDAPGGFGGFGGNQGGFGGMAGMGGGAGGGSSQSSANQSVGGGMGGGMGGGGMGGGAFFIAPEKSVSEKVRIVCLEHGKKDPRPSVKYQIVPLDCFTKNKTTQVLCQMLGDPNIDQYAVQAAVWNEENNVSFNEMSQKTVGEMGTNVKKPYFTSSQLQSGTKILTVARQKADELKAKEKEENTAVHQTDEGTRPVDKTIEKLTDQLIKE
ncbi:MAG: hypothetical protein Q4G69_04100 [Planctomycetia bacterium]|nr:hypothetical protein [Planctomycetia bacterium]